MIGMNLLHRLPVFVFLAISFIAVAQNPAPGQPKPLVSKSIAQLIGVQSEIGQLQKFADNTASVDRWKILWLHQHISEQVMAVSLQVDATIAQIDNEIALANEVRGYLADRRDRTVSRINLFSVIVGGSVGATSSGLQLSSSLLHRTRLVWNSRAGRQEQPIRFFIQYVRGVLRPANSAE
jgi:hypothetical protein